MTKPEFQIKAQMIFNDLFKEAFYCEEFNENIYDVSYNLGSAFASSVYTACNGDLPEENMIEMNINFLTGANEKYDLLISKYEDLQIVDLEGA